MYIYSISLDAESHEEQDERNQISVGSTMAELWPILWPYVSEKDEKRFLLFV